MPRLIHIPPIGSIEIIDASDEAVAGAEIKRVLNGGYMEMVSSTIHPRMAVMIDTDGKEKNLPDNPRATRLIVGMRPGDGVTGSAVFFGIDAAPDLGDCPLSAADLAYRAAHEEWRASR
jgi:hypothetical protein